jgi:hypothetical protein
MSAGLPEVGGHRPPLQFFEPNHGDAIYCCGREIGLLPFFAIGETKNGISDIR